MGASAPTALVACLFLAVYALHHAVPPGAAPISLAVATGLLYAVPLFLLLRRLAEIRMGVDPVSDPGTTAVFIAGCDRSVGWFLTLRLCELGMTVYAGFEDPSSAPAQWLKRYLKDGVHLVRIRPGNEEDASAAVQQVEGSLGHKALVAVIYAMGNIPKTTETLDTREIENGIKVNALGAVTLSQYFGPTLQKYGGRFVVLTDLAGRAQLPSILPYCMSHAVAQHFINSIRKDMEKLGVSVHAVEPLLYIWESAQSKTCYPGTSEEDGKVILSSEAQQLDHDLFDITQSIYHACFSKAPKARYLPTLNDLLMDKVISYGPSCLVNWAARHVEEVKNIYVPPLEQGWEE